MSLAFNLSNQKDTLIGEYFLAFFGNKNMSMTLFDAEQVLLFVLDTSLRPGRPDAGAHYPKRRSNPGCSCTHCSCPLPGQSQVFEGEDVLYCRNLVGLTIQSVSGPGESCPKRKVCCWCGIHSHTTLCSMRKKRTFHSLKHDRDYSPVNQLQSLCSAGRPLNRSEGVQGEAFDMSPANDDSIFIWRIGSLACCGFLVLNCNLY